MPGQIWPELGDLAGTFRAFFEEFQGLVVKCRTWERECPLTHSITRRFDRPTDIGATISAQRRQFAGHDDPLRLRRMRRSCTHRELFGVCPGTVPAPVHIFEMERLTPRWSRVLTYTLRSELKPRNDPLGTWRSMASVLPALWRVPYPGATMQADIEFAAFATGFQRVSVIASMIDMFELAYGSSSSAPRPCSLAPCSRIPVSTASMPIRSSGARDARHHTGSMPKPQ